MNTLTALQSVPYILPEIILAVGICVVFLVDLFIKGENKETVGITAFAFFLAAFVSLTVSSNPPAFLFSGMLVSDSLNTYFKYIFLTSGAIATLISMSTFTSRKINSGEYYALILTATLGTLLMSGSSNLLTIAMSIEIVSIVSYVLAGYNKENMESSEASLKYVLYGAMSSGIMLYGASILYGLTGKLNLHEIYIFLANNSVSTYALTFSVLMILGGIGYKIAFAPFHFWCPDVYQGSPTPVAAFFSVAPKAAGFSLLLRFISLTFTNDVTLANWIPALEEIGLREIFIVVSVLTMTIGNLSALSQTNVKRLLAYSSIAHAGYMLMGISALSLRGAEAIVFYLTTYLFMNFGAFFVVDYISKKVKSEEIYAFKGLKTRAPFLAFTMTVFLASLTGLPPMAGFVGKFYLFSALADAKLYLLAVLGLLNSVVSLFYYWRIARAMYLEDALTGEKVEFELGSGLLASVLAGFTILLGIYFNPLSVWIQNSMTIYFG
ncbi:NADH-quinone oxidoreductase subunit N [bacterium]|nr:NADH-quinone oxidoreductase subunit N [bacterium]